MTSAADSGSPSGRQKGINDFFSVTGVISSSPHKSSQPCSSTHADRLDVEPKVVKEEEEEEEEDDDISLLAAAVAMDPEAEEEVDDVSLLAADMTPELEVQQEEGGVDYLEGMTAEMFGDDDEFNQCDGDIHNECKEVEALPDTHYGLLGSEKVLLQPQGCMDDLPEEVLRQVLCRIPARDLYCNVSLVCQHWRNIVQDPKVNFFCISRKEWELMFTILMWLLHLCSLVQFVPFKKQYFRYMMRETATMLEVCGILKSSHIMDPASSEHSLRHLVV